MRRARARLARGDLEGAVAAADEDRRALEVVAFHVLRRGISRDETRRWAEQGFRGAGSLARGPLREIAEEARDDVTRAAALALLVQNGRRWARSRLRRFEGHDNPEVRRRVARALVPTLRERRALERWLADDAPEVRRETLRALWRREDLPWLPEAVARMALRDEEWTVRAAAIHTLSHLTQDGLLVDTAEAMLDRSDNPATARLAAIDALGRAEQVQTVEAILRRRLQRGSSAERVRAAAILASFGDQVGHESLRRSLASPNSLEVREAAMAASRVGGPLTDALLDCLDRPDPAVRLAVAQALLRLGQDDRARPTLTALMDLPGMVGLQAALALARAGDESSGAAVRVAAALQDDDPAVRRYAAFSCGGLPFGLELAIGALADSDQAVRIAAASAVLRRFRRDDLQRGRRSVMIPRPPRP